MAHAVRELSTLTWEEAAALGSDGGAVIGVLPVGAIEAHGPHLPLGTDVLISEAMARAGAERLAYEGHAPVLLPALPYTAAPFAAGFAGTLSVRPQTVSALVVEIGGALAAHGFAGLAIANSHLDPAHLEALARAAAALKAEGRLAVAAPDLTRKPWGSRLTEEFRSGSCHAGRFETSVVLARRPELVREEVRGRLPPVDRSLSAAIREGVRTFEEAGGRRAYFGRPAEASAAEGRSTIAALGDILAEAMTEALRERGSGDG